jgi:oxalate decarboxylase/phosphoglucose isomerase-like protein (cupin superfamily)
MPNSSGVTSRDGGFEGQTWNILDQIYVPKHVTETSFSWHATLPAGSFVPLHVHDTQDEFIFMLDGRLEFVLDDRNIAADAGDLVSLPKLIPHSIHNRSLGTVKCLFWVSPTRRLYEYFQKINNMRDVAEMTRLAALHEVPFI